ncbi:PREDICTED: protein CUP-SHAPED COTYLEDON 3-like [Nelumbo nucifera]|uniref:Protein CUP-SHAPED COTYLEDON 3-like n=2 Tax=Nelumbo nucifera TaxID=4432 RepID=A0A1U8B3C6_NELNU|nr:PREDICTED: protein CUP-SHAPED COTYLEDON 3-like [Nelumbo nucifera]DAD46514.1 TPA_asm: hypothetical protein HUJ06_016451 [Nelumbo nucifera]
MLAMEEILCEVHGEDTNEQGLPPGFRFHPTDEELITFYLASKVFKGSFSGVDIAEVDLNRCEPWELPDIAKMGEREWYFFSLRDRKYPTGLRTNRATEAGYWKATGKDREVYSASNGALLGMKKTLVFYKGRAPRGEKTKWVMHEYRLDGDFAYRHTCKEEWVICRIFHKTGGEKKSPFFQAAHGYLMEACSSSPSTCLPPLLEPPTTVMDVQSSIQSLQNNYLIHQENGVKNLINPVSTQTQLFPMSSSSLLRPSFSPTTINPNNPSHSILLKSLLSHQDCTLKQATVQKQCKTESNFSHFQPLDANLHWVDKIHQNPLFIEMGVGGPGGGGGGGGPGPGGGVLGFTAVADTVHEMSTSVAFNRAGFQMMLDPPIRGAGESGP